MRYSREHKLETHARIVKKASVRLREKGAHGIGVADLMKDAGLTHGGFYAHFNSREALVIEAFAHAMDRSTERWRKLAEQTPPDKRLATIVDSYLTPMHRDDPGHGCAVPTLGAEIARESPKTRKAFAAKLEQMIDMLAEQIPDVPRKAARKQAMAALATMMGTLVLARIAGNGEFSDEILGAGREAVLGRAAPPKRAREEIRRSEKPPRRRGTDRPSRSIAFDIGRRRSKTPAKPAFSQIRCARKPFPNAAKTARCRQNPAFAQVLEERMRSIGHFIGGREVKGTSGRFADVFRADDRRRPGQGGAGLQGRAARRGRERQGRAVGVGRHQSAAPRPRHDEVPRTGAARLRQARRSAGARTRQDRSRRQGRHPARPRGGRIRLRHSASDEGRIYRRRRPRHRHLFDAAAARRRRRHHAVQFPGDDPDVEIRARDRLRQCLHPEAVGARSRRADDAGGN